MNIVYKSVDELIPYEKNTKKHDKKQIKNVATSIDKYGFVQPLVIDKNNVVIIGHCRLLGAKQLKMEKVPCVCAEDLTEEEVNALRIVDNKSNESEWDMDILAEELGSVDLSAFDFDFDFPIDEEEQEEVVEDDVPEIDEESEPITKLGDIWQLGRHRLMCGDSTDKATVERLMDGAKADMVFTDPPYALFGNSTGVAGVVDDKMTRPFFLSIFQRLRENTKLFGHIYACCDWHSAFSLEAMAKQAGLTEKNLCIWDKGDGGLGAMYQQCYEMVWFFANSPLATTTVGKKKAGERTINGKPNIWRYPRENSAERVHNAQKPLDMVAYAIENSSDKNENVLDLFGGSGTTLIAAEKVNRTCYMMEMEPKYCDVIVKRWETLTGEKAVLISK